eukprot:5195440-Alexandrium_andersonii.AAC.1
MHWRGAQCTLAKPPAPEQRGTLLPNLFVDQNTCLSDATPMQVVHRGTRGATARPLTRWPKTALLKPNNAGASHVPRHSCTQSSTVS